ncbi:PREDICTED: CLAVATA3/ESR (CLE)-related protein 27 [Tarenaya hassleriana]|uniref:CLAVATA3/ESR (CLE)-related protein 27 n=1 Tax=Tarenaya hassleriana TaxID=28532 RepID=UPI0008FCE95A|nr:PREDICTED: CLAVATA3/ESR (CLE)-related protein 27 [Tarenaya hassleriana]
MKGILQNIFSLSLSFILPEKNPDIYTNTTKGQSRESRLGFNVLISSFFNLEEKIYVRVLVGMSQVRERRSSSVIMVFLISTLLIHIWVLPENAGLAAAIRVFPEVPASNQQGLMKKYFAGKVSPAGRVVGLGNGFQDNKRTVPSCPDPLHN